MRPVLKIDDIRDLHDARYCAAVGIGLLGFRFGELESDAPKPEQVAEIMEWLSGPEGVAEFGFVPSRELNATATAAKCRYASLPASYPRDWAKEVDAVLIWRVDEHVQAALAQVLELLGQFPASMAEVSVETALALADSDGAGELISRILVRADKPDPLHVAMNKAGFQPWGFTLGEFVEEEGGGIDYAACDAFLEACL